MTSLFAFFFDIMVEFELQLQEKCIFLLPYVYNIVRCDGNAVL